ncbi:hypothetical protein WJX74_000861 [Apatococcus lobatus]|uniref:Kinesin motor domain-containing protein n=1 Tax=Apatococcus lobatus TaxID=904363 RepID=A0AAW1RDI8_9CHLO
MAWFFPLLFRLASVGITLFYPAWGSINAIESAGGADDTQWLVYWLIYALFTMLESTLWVIFKWIPGYTLVRLAFFAWLVLPQTKGATFVYEAVLAPIVKIARREIAKNPSLDKTLNGPLAQGSSSGITSQARSSNLDNALQNARTSLSNSLQKIDGLQNPSDRRKAELSFDRDVSRLGRLGGRNRSQPQQRRTARLLRQEALMDSAPGSKIPIPPNRALKPLSASEVNKRKRPAPASPSKLDAKRTDTKPTSPLTVFKAQEESWVQISEEKGWSLEDCLNYKLLFKKGKGAGTDKAKMAALSAHIKSLRAAGWHLFSLADQREADRLALLAQLQTEQSEHAAAQQQHTAGVQELQIQIGNLKNKVAESLREAAGLRESGAEVQKQVERGQADIKSAADREHWQAQDLARSREQVTSLQQQVSHLTEQHQRTQTYNAQLQEYNGQLQGEVQTHAQATSRLQAEKNQWCEDMAALRGKVAALDSQVQAAQGSAATAEEARQNANSDASRLRAELTSLSAERDSLTQDLTASQKEVQQYKEHTGKSLEALEQETTRKAQLQYQNKAQEEINAGLQERLAMAEAGLQAAQSLAEGRAGEAGVLAQQACQLRAQLAEATSKWQEGEVLRRRLHNTIMELKGNIRVFCRVRPLLESDAGAGPTSLQYPNSGDLMGRALEMSVPSTVPGQPPQKHDFAFDRVFAPSIGQGEVFEDISQLVQSALDGYRVCIFAYGQTGSGKTHTMLGSPADRGMIPRAMDQLFASAAAMKEQGWTFEMQASMLEIYNEEYKDLLGKGPPAGKKHQVAHDEDGGTSITFAEALDVSGPDAVASLLKQAMRQRAVGATAMNERSSRSHMVFALRLRGTNATTGIQAHGVLNLIDLAGSERLSKSLACGDRLKETQAINKSLSALGDVIMALANKESHVPYRNSKLTYLLQPCLGGDSKTLMFVNVAPSADAAAESLCSLRFAAKLRPQLPGRNICHLAHCSFDRGTLPALLMPLNHLNALLAYVHLDPSPEAGFPPEQGSKCTGAPLSLFPTVAAGQQPVGYFGSCRSGFPVMTSDSEVLPLHSPPTDSPQSAACLQAPDSSLPFVSLTSEALQQLTSTVFSSSIEAARWRATSVLTWAVQASQEVFCSQSLDQDCSQASSGQGLPTTAGLAVPIERRVSLDNNPGSCHSSMLVEPMLPWSCSSEVSDATEPDIASVSSSSCRQQPEHQSASPQWSDESGSESSEILVVDAHDVFTPPANWHWRGASPRRTFSPLSAADSGQPTPMQPGRQQQAQSQSPAEIASVLAGFPDTRHISSGYMRVQQALGKGQPPLAATHKKQQPHPAKPQGALQKKAIPCAAAAPAFDPKEPFPWDPLDRLQALQEWEQDHSACNIEQTGSADKAQGIPAGAVECSNHSACQFPMDLHPSRSGSVSSCWDSAASHEGFHYSTGQKPCPLDVWAIVKPKSPGNFKPAVQS